MTKHSAVLIRYEIRNDVWTEVAQTVFASAEEAEAAAEAQLDDGQEMAWAETQIGLQGSVADVEYDDWKHVWEIAGWDGEGIEELQYEDDE